MNEWIMNIARGEFEYKNQKLVLPENPITIEVEAGKEATGSFPLRNERGTPIKGKLHSTDNNLQLIQNHFMGKQCEIVYKYSAKHRVPGESVKGSVRITSDHGEYEVLFLVHVSAPSFETSMGRIKDLHKFANLAKDYPEEALKIFKSGEFETVFLYRDAGNSLLYRSLIKSPLTSQAMEEFLIATRKKVRIQLDVDKRSFEYKDCDKEFMDKVVLNKNAWGFTEIWITSDADFLMPEHKVLWTDRFMGNAYSLEFKVDPKRMHRGKNYGTITIQTIHQCITVEVFASLKKKETHDRLHHLRRMANYGITRNYLAFRMDRIGLVEYVSQMKDLLARYGEALDGYAASLIQTHIAMVEGKDAEVRAFIKEKEEFISRGWMTSYESVVEYAGALYVKAMFTKEEGHVREAADNVRRYYENGYMDWKILWFLLNVDRRYDKEGVRLEAILSHVREGCHSPVLYLEAFQIYNDHPDWLRELNRETIAIIKWGIDEGLCGEELALRYTYQAGRMKRFHPLVLRGLETIYERYPQKDMLHAICSLLIRNEQRGKKYFKWFRMGVKEQLRITDIYEYFMYTMEEGDETELPPSLLHYFMYDNHLNDRRKALLYARIVREKNENPSNYEHYRKIIERFARKQWEAGHVSVDLATIYEDVVTRETLDARLARKLPNVMFRYEITCLNPNMAGACVVHKETSEEAYVPFVSGKAQVDVYTENARIFMVDKKENRYVETMDYTGYRLLHLDDLAMDCYQVCGDNPKLQLFAFIKTESQYPINRENLSLYKEAVKRLPLSDQYRKKNVNALIQYAYENGESELLGELLEDVDVGLAEPGARAKWAELFMAREMYGKAMEMLDRYGYEGIDLYRLGKLCTYLVLSIEGDYGKELIKICHYLFTKERYSEPIMECLIENFEGTNEEMLQIWRASGDFQIDRRRLEERLLSQILFTGVMVKEGIPVYESYSEHGGNRQLKKAYLSYLAYQNVTQGGKLPDSIYDKMEKSVLYEENKACMLALLKRYAYQDEWDAKERDFVGFHLSKFLDEDFLLPYFLKFDGKIPLPSKLKNVCMVEYVGDPNVPVTIRYRISGDDKAYEEPMKNVYNGIFVKSCLLFQDEELVYRILIGRNGEWEEVKRGTLKPPSGRIEKMESNFSLINDMLGAKREKEKDRLRESMERYLKRQYVLERLFEPIS